LGKKLDYENEIVISNSTERQKNLEDYHFLLIKAFEACYRMLKPDHWMTLTFHNRFFEIWDILLDSIKQAGFEYQSTNFLVPAVIPAKAQLSKEGSLEGDLIMHFRKPIHPTQSKISSLEPKQIEKKIIKRVEDVLCFMGDKATSSQILNSVLFLLLNLDHTKISFIDLKSILQSNFKLKKGYWEFKSNPNRSKKTFHDQLKKIVSDEKNLSLTDHELIAKVYDEFEVWQVPSISFVRNEIQEMKKLKK